MNATISPLPLVGSEQTSFMVQLFVVRFIFELIAITLIVQSLTIFYEFRLSAYHWYWYQQAQIDIDKTYQFSSIGFLILDLRMGFGWYVCFNQMLWDHVTSCHQTFTQQSTNASIDNNKLYVHYILNAQPFGFTTFCLL